MSLTKVSYSMITGAPVNVLDFGADNTGATDAGPAIQTALNSGAAVVVFPAGTYKIVTKCILTNTSLKSIEGYGATLVGNMPIPANPPENTYEQYMLNFANNDVQVIIAGITFRSFNPTVTFNQIWYGGVFSFQYQTLQAAVWVPDGSVLKDCTFTQLSTAVYIGKDIDFPEDRKTKVEDCKFQGNLVTFTAYLCNHVEFTGNTAYLGSEITFPSVRNAIITNNDVFLPNTPSINVGGSAAVQGNQCIISNNIAYGRDPIVVENGFNNVTITNNQCFCMEGLPQGVAIGVTTGSDAFGQAVNQVVISGNLIGMYVTDTLPLTNYAFGIRIDININSVCKDVIINNNLIIEPSNGISVEGFSDTQLFNGVTINDNTLRGVLINGIIVDNCQNVYVDSNKLTSAATPTKGIFFGKVNRATLINNDTFDFQTNHYYFNAPTDSVKIITPIHNATTEALLWGFGGTFAGFLLCRNVVFPTGGTPALGQWVQGSSIINPLPASAVYYGTVCTVTGSPGTWKTYGLIS